MSNNNTTDSMELEERNPGELPQTIPENPDVDGDHELLIHRSNSRTAVPKRKSMLPQAPDEEPHNFLVLVQSVNIDTVKENLEKNPDLTTFTNIQGVSALEEAVKSGSAEMLQLFLNQTGKSNKAEVIDHAILYSIKEDSLSLFELCLKERDQVKQKSRIWKDRKARLPGYEDAEYATYITPIILAAKLERQKMIKILIERKITDIHPLTDQCPFGKEERTCVICSERNVFQNKRNLEDSKHLLEIYKALSSPAYISLSGVKDPILEAFYLSKELRQMQEETPSFKSEYEALAKSCRTFATELLNLCRTTSEVEVLLKNREGVNKVDLQGDTTEYPRVLVCLDFNQLEFIAHPYTQQVLQKNWFDGLPNWFSDSKWKFTRLLYKKFYSEFHYLKWLLYWLLWIPLCPFCCILYMLRIPWFVRLMKKPINKFVTNTLSTLIFLILIVVINVNSDIKKHRENFQWLEYVFIVWLLGMTSHQAKMLWRRRYNCGGGHWFDMTIFLSFWLWVILQTTGIILPKVSKMSNTRVDWSMDHPILISEAFFALGTILSFLGLTSLLKASSTLGPLQISLKKMIRDTVRFMLIFVIIMTGFVVATMSVYMHYQGSKRIEHGKETRRQADGYIGLQNTYKTYFWNIFGYGEVGNADIVVNYTDTTHSNTTASLVPKHKFTEGVGYVIVASYYIVAVVVMLNMLIAMMANSYNTIAANADSEWKFARTRLWMTYYSDVCALPPPFNVPLLGTITKYMVKWCTNCCKCCEVLNNSYSPTAQSDEVYVKLIGNLKKRYWNHRGATERRLISRGQDYGVTDSIQQNANLYNE